MPREHGAWAILAVPLILGVIAAGPAPGHALLALAAVSAYLFSVPATEWMRTRRPELRPPTLLFGAATAAFGIPLVAMHTAIALFALVAAAAGLIALALSLGGRATSVLVSLVQVAQAIALVPAAAVVTGRFDAPATLEATLAAAIYLIGSVLVVRSLIRARNDLAYLAVSVAFHAVAVVVAALLLPGAYAVLAVGLLARAIALPIAQRRLEGGSHRLRPIHIGIVEIVASLALVLVAVVAGF